MVEDKQSWIAWQTVNKVSRSKSTARAKLKAASQEERIHLWKQHFRNLLGKPPKVTGEPITKVLSNQLDIKLTVYARRTRVSTTKNRKAAGLDEISPEVWKTIDRWTKGCILHFPKKGDFGIVKNYRGITLTFIAAKIYNALLRNSI